MPEPRAKTVKLVNEALEALFPISPADRPPSTPALSRELDLPRPAVYRTLDALQGRRVVARLENPISFKATKRKDHSGLPGHH